jgi:hypothetical protein
MRPFQRLVEKPPPPRDDPEPIVERLSWPRELDSRAAGPLWTPPKASPRSAGSAAKLRGSAEEGARKAGRFAALASPMRGAAVRGKTGSGTDLEMVSGA